MWPDTWRFEYPKIPNMPCSVNSMHINGWLASNLNYIGMLVLSSCHYKLKRAYQLYYYSFPLPVLTRNESIIFNSISLVLLLLGAYWFVFKVPSFLMKSAENLHYYLTGSTVSISVALSLALTSNIIPQFSRLTLPPKLSNTTVPTNKLQDFKGAMQKKAYTLWTE